MSESREADIINAAATGAAAAVDAVQDEHHEDDRQAAMEAATATAADTATEAGEEAERAAAAATAASEAALEARAEAGEAEAIATQAATEASEAQSGVESLRSFMESGFSELREFIGTLKPSEPDNQPEEVTVSHGTTDRENSREEGSDSGSGESASGISGEDRPYRHRFGRRRG